MRRRLLAALSSAAAVSLSFVALATSADAAPSHGFAHRNDHVCTSPAPGSAACSAIRHDTVDSAGNPVNTPAAASPNRGTTSNVTPAGFGPADIQSAYNLAGLKSGGKTVAIVDAYDDPYAERDLGVYRAQFGLPACTTANGCFKKVSQTGSTTRLPSRSGGWAQEISLDLDMVSSACPDCHILLVEASTASFANLGTAVNYAATHGAVAISNSYGGSESGTGSYAKYYNHPGIAVTASTGDSGYGAQAPASMDGVVAVGGTSLVKAGNTRGWSESAWSGAGSGCSALNAKPTYQSAATGCSNKAAADVSAVADPNTGVAVYDSYSYQGYSGWMVFGGTSASSPIVASVYALAHNLTSGQVAGSTVWADPSGLNDVVGGSNGSCPTTQWCTAVTGWDGPTGLGTPNGIAAF